MSSLDQLRQKHIESLAQFEPIRIDSNTYQIPCHLAAITVILVIKLPTRYPEVKPTIEISNTDVHHSLIQNGVIDHQRLRTWNLNSSLARLVEDILMGFTLSPPVFISKYSLQTTLEGLNPLDHKTDSEVEELLNDENCFAEYFFELPEVSPSKQFNDELLTKNAREAEQNLNRESEIKDLKERVAKLQASNIKHRSELDSLLTVQQKELLRFNSSHVTDQLRQLVAAADDMSELSAASFLEGKLTEEEFIKVFRESRKLYHLRNQKLGKLQE